MKNLSLILVLALSMLFVQSCQKEGVNDEYSNQPTPQLPAEASFLMPTEGFTNLDGANDDQIEDRTFTNWGYAAGNVLVWNSLITMHLAVPVLSFRASFNHEAVYQGGGVWLWAYTFRDKGSTFRAELYGELAVGDMINWTMYISKDGGFGRVLWYSGTTANDGSSATWDLNFDPNNPRPIVHIDYTKDLVSQDAQIRYTNVINGTPEQGGYIEYRHEVSAATEFNRHYDVFKAELDNLLEINWNSLYKNGQVKDPVKFMDEDWRCWGTDLHDADCQ